jgi:hypothetical protein
MWCRRVLNGSLPLRLSAKLLRGAADMNFLDILFVRADLLHRWPKLRECRSRPSQHHGVEKDRGKASVAFLEVDLRASMLASADDSVALDA